ncbi:DEKNAAC105363 [Brettanomyces naardenensis]|uniref:DEKNAAC105363 n=1 Tax=Brettanomyces naardenensis TaxID=13370 RepID=A0A448YT80_BRENA|nr:DEKNAAC105363 [Brettanomyces naardenensis]
MLRRVSCLRSQLPRLFVVGTRYSPIVSRFNSTVKDAAGSADKVVTSSSETTGPASAISSDPSILTPLQLHESNISTQDALGGLVTDLQTKSLLSFLQSSLPQDPTKLLMKPVECQKRVSGYPIRQSLPRTFQEATPEAVNSYIQQLTLYTYPKHHKEMSGLINMVINNSHALQLLNKESFVALTEYFARQGRFDMVFKIKNDWCPAELYDADFYETLFDYLGTKKPMTLLQKYLWNLKAAKLSINSKLLYQIYYLLLPNQRDIFVKYLKSVGYSINEIVPDINYTSIDTADELHTALKDHDVAMTPGILKRTVELLLKEKRYAEAWSFAEYQRTENKYIVSPIIGEMFTHTFLQNGEAYFVLPFVTRFSRITGADLRQFALEQLLESQLQVPVDESWLEITKPLVKAASQSRDTTLKFNLPRRVSSYVKSGGFKSFRIDPRPNSKEAEIMRSLYWPNSPNFDISSNNDRFKATAKLYGGIEKELFEIPASVDELLESEGLQSTWEKFDELTKGGKDSKLVASCGLRFVRYLLNEKKPQFALAVASLLKTKYSVDIRFDTYREMAQSYLDLDDEDIGSSWWFVLRWLYTETYSDARWWFKVSPYLARTSEQNDFKPKKFTDGLTPAEEGLARQIVGAVQWENTANFVDESNTETFRTNSSYLLGNEPDLSVNTDEGKLEDA